MRVASPGPFGPSMHVCSERRAALPPFFSILLGMAERSRSGKGQQAERPDAPRIVPVAGGAEGHIAMGNVLMQQGHFARAIAEFDAALAEKPDMAQAHLGIGTARLSTRDRDGAIAAYKAAIDANRDSSAARLALGLVYYREQRRDEARAELLRAGAIDPARPIVRFALGCLALEEKDYPRAIAELEAELALDPATSPGRRFSGDAYRAQCRCLLGDALRALGKKDEAVASYRAALKENRRFAPAYHRLGDVQYVDERRLEDAIPTYEMALLLHPLMTGVHAQLGRLRADLGQHAAAVEHYRSELVVSPDAADVWRDLARSCEALGQTDEAARALAEAERAAARVPAPDAAR